MWGGTKLCCSVIFLFLDFVRGITRKKYYTVVGRYKASFFCDKSFSLFRLCYINYRENLPAVWGGTKLCSSLLSLCDFVQTLLEVLPGENLPVMWGGTKKLTQSCHVVSISILSSTYLPFKNYQHCDEMYCLSKIKNKKLCLLKVIFI